MVRFVYGISFGMTFAVVLHACRVGFPSGNSKGDDMRKFTASLAVAAGLLSAPAANAAGVVFIIGSDVISFHQDSSYINPVFDQMANFGPKKLLFVSDWGASSTNYTNGNIAIDFQPLS